MSVDENTEKIQSNKIRRIIEAGISGKKMDQTCDLTPLSYQRLENYIVNLENKVILLGGELPKVIY